MPETTENYKHIRVRHPDRFSKFRVITRMSHLDEDDQKLVRKHVRKSKRPACKYTVGKLKEGKKIGGRSWKLQKIMQPINRKGGYSKVGRKKKAKKKAKKKTKKWGSIGSPSSDKRKKHLAKIRKKRKKK